MKIIEDNANTNKKTFIITNNIKKREASFKYG